MSPKDWITMGNELRAELDALGMEVRAWVFMCAPSWMDPEFHRECAPAVLALPPAQRDPLTARALERGSERRYSARRFYTDALSKLRSHGRANDWPDRMWPEEDERG